MKLLDEIRSQPSHIREVFMWLCVIITFSLFAFVSMRSTGRQFVAILHPEQAEQDRALAQARNKEQPSVFATIGDAWGNIQSGVADILGAGRQIEIFQSVSQANVLNSDIRPNLFPVAEDR